MKKQTLLFVSLLFVLSGCFSKAEAKAEEATCSGKLQETEITTTMKAKNHQITEQRIQLHTDYAGIGYSRKQAQNCIKQYEKDYADIKGLSYQGTVTEKQIEQLLVLNLTAINSNQLKKLEFIQSTDGTMFDINKSVSEYERQGLTCSTKQIDK